MDTPTATTPLRNVLERLQGVKKNGSGWQAPCPAHDDQHASLSLKQGEDGRVLVHCHANCTAEAVVEALGLKVSDLFPPRQNAERGGRGRIVATYDYHDADGKLVFQVVRYKPKSFKQRRPDGANGWTWNMKGVQRVPFQMPDIKAAIEHGHTIFVCEGEKDCLNLRALSVPATTNPGGAGKWLKSYSELLKGAKVVVLPDSDEPGRKHAQKVAASLHGLAASVKVLELPGLLDKEDVSDWLAGGHTREELLELAAACPASEPTEEEEVPQPSGAQSSTRYRATPAGLVWLKETANGPVTTVLTNFTAKIIADVAEDDGVESRRMFELEANSNRKSRRFNVAGSQFSSMSWVTEHLGAGAIVAPGFGLRDHARCAIQELSNHIEERTVFTHLGWRQANAEWLYLYGGGAIGADGPAEGVEVRLPDMLSRYVLPNPPEGEPLIGAIRKSLELINLAPESITFPLFAAIWRAIIGGSDFSIHISGPTGAGKSELAALVQQFWGAGLDSRHLPGSWASTGNSLEAMAFLVKDAIFAIDDFAPGGTSADVARIHRDVDRVLRSQGNRAGRQRLRSDTSLRAAKPPRGLILSTGEDVPRGQSLRSRMLVLELTPDDLDWEKLTLCQRDAAAGVYASALAGFVRWIAARQPLDFRADLLRLREAATASGQHRRTPEIAANLAIGLGYFLDFAQYAGALTEAEAKDFFTRAWTALGKAAEAQAQHQAASEPARRFIELLQAALASGAAHIANADGEAPAGLEAACGWRERTFGAGDNKRTEWQAQGDRVGWLKDESVYLIPDAAFRVAQAMGRDGGENLSLGPSTLRKRLRERGYLVTCDETRQRLTVRRVLEGAGRDVLDIHARCLISPEPSKPSIPSI